MTFSKSSFKLVKRLSRHRQATTKKKTEIEGYLF